MDLQDASENATGFVVLPIETSCFSGFSPCICDDAGPLL